MNHLDEGTIHAWLDGALDSAQSADVEAHVAACSTCAAMAAEARGFIAAASRILGALDDDRANVIPPPAPSKVVPIAGARRVRRTAPWLMAVAAVLVAAVVLRTTDATRNQVMSEAATLRSPVAASGLDSALPAPPPAISAAAGQPARPSSAALEGRSATRTDASAAKVAANTPAPAEQTRMRAMAQSAPAPARAEVGSVGGVAGGASVAASVEASAVAAKSAQREVATLMLADQADAGCYPLPAASGFNAPAPTVASGAASRTSDRRAAARAAAPQAAPSAMAADFASVSRMVRLDPASPDAARAVRIVPSDSVVGSWRVAGDSIHVELGAGRSFTVARTARTTCP